MSGPTVCVRFFFNDTATTEIYTLSLHDALPICQWLDLLARSRDGRANHEPARVNYEPESADTKLDRKSTRLNSSHQIISYAVFCLKKKKRFWRQNAGEDAIAGFLSNRRRAKEHV